VEEGHDETTRGRERWRMQEIYPDRAPTSLGCVVAVIASLVMNMGGGGYLIPLKFIT
jgi:hypothetical protein